MKTHAFTPILISVRKFGSAIQKNVSANESEMLRSSPVLTNKRKNQPTADGIVRFAVTVKP